MYFYLTLFSYLHNPIANFLIDSLFQTFYVNIDLTSYNAPLRQPRRGVSRTATGTAADEHDVDEAASPPEGGPDNTMHVDGEEEEDDQDEADDQANAGRVQIMELHSKNPFVSYRNHIFSCEWADMIGTDMHFISHEDSEPNATYLKRTDDYSLLAANPIKIVGRKARLTANTDLQESREQAEERSAQAGLQTQECDTRSAQVRFLQELMDIKQEKGETDMVQMTFGTKRGKSFEEKISRWAHSEDRVNLIHQLNRAALGGDPNAIAKLEELYTSIESGADDVAAGPSNSESVMATDEES